MNIFIQFLVAILLWCFFVWFSYWWTYEYDRPTWIRNSGQVFNCRYCFYFWSNLFTVLGLFFIFGSHCWWFFGSGILLTALTTTAIMFEEGNREMSMEELEQALKDAQKENNDNQNV